MSRLIDADAFKEKYGDYYAEEEPAEGFIGTVGQLIDNAPTVEPAQKVIVVQPEIIDPVAKAIVDTIYKLDWNTIIKMYRGGSCKGEWIMNNLMIDEWMCSVCHEKFDDIPTCMGEPLYKFCPECGADLRGDV